MLHQGKYKASKDPTRNCLLQSQKGTCGRPFVCLVFVKHSAIIISLKGIKVLTAGIIRLYKRSLMDQLSYCNVLPKPTLMKQSALKAVSKCSVFSPLFTFFQQSHCLKLFKQNV